jgi:hypothetical protein
MALNQELKSVVRQLYADVIEDLKKDGIDLASPEFLGKSYIYLPRGKSETRTRMISAAFAPEFRPVAEEAIQAFYANSSGLTVEDYMCEAVNDFLNYVVPRAAGLKEESEIFDAAYTKFDHSIYGESFLATTFAVLGGWPRLISEKRLWVAHPCGFCFMQGWGWFSLAQSFP